MTGLGWSAAVAVEENEGEEDAATAGGGTEERGRSVCRGGRSVWLRATNGKMTGAKMGVGSSLRR